jgi:DNA-binding transcriptional regulator YdaS (Cro superfamily)
MSESQDTRTALRRFLDAFPGEAREFAERCGISPAHLSNIADGRRACSYPVAVKIATMTGGVVPVESMLRKVAA